MIFEKIHIGKGEENAFFSLNKLNRHGLIAGATGTGKTVTLKVLAEQLSKRGIPVFLADVKGDLASLAEIGEENEKISQRLIATDTEEYTPQSFPVTLWDVFGEEGIPIRANISDLGPLLFSRLIELNEVQEGLLNIAFDLADKNGLLLIDIKDLRAILNFMQDNAEELRRDYGNITAASIGAITRRLLVLEKQGAEYFFGDPAMEIHDLFQERDGKGVINILSAVRLLQNPKLYSTFLLWLLSKLYDTLPEVGDLSQPKLVFFFDEAHLLFTDAPKPLLDKLELTVRLIRSKGVGVFFITQNPTDVPDSILNQLGNKVQHALRAFTPKEQKNVKLAAETFRPREGMNVAEAITSLSVGEALVSTLDDSGAPTPVDRVMIAPPESKIGTLDPMKKEILISGNILYDKYYETIDPKSAYEVLTEQNQAKEKERLAAQEERLREKEKKEKDLKFNRSSIGRLQNNVLGSIGREVGRQLIRGIFGTLKR